VIIANWKANGDIESNKAWCNQLIVRMSDRGLKSIGIAPSFIHFNQVKNAFIDNDIISKKYKMLAKHHIKPVLCIGESFEDFQAGITEKKLQTQIEECTQGNILSENLIIAYEPVWAIGTGNTPKPKDVNTIHEFIKDVVQSATENNIVPQVLYGGSVNKNNAADFFVQQNIDGALIGGASLNADIFSDIIDIYRRLRER
jgi:triosephosphate isomerase